MDATVEFASLVACPDDEVNLARGALLIAAHSRLHRGLNVAAQEQRIDALADGCDAHVDAVTRRVYADAGLRGNRTDYEDPRNSFLPDVLDRRLGIPITLAIVAIEVGRRVGVNLHGVGMPGHFLVGTGDNRWLDPFDGGRILDLDGAAGLYRRVHGPLAPFHRSFLGPTSPRAIFARILTNLEHHLANRDPREAAWPIRLQLCLPGVDPETRYRLAVALGNLGAFLEAAAELDRTASELPDRRADAARTTAAALRSRAN